MPITRSAKKALRQTKKKTVKNVKIKNQLKTITRKVQDLIKDGKTEDASKILKDFNKAVDKAAKKNIIKKNTANRKKSRMAKAIKRSKAAPKKKEVKNPKKK